MGKTIAMIFGWVLLLVGILGFISNPIVGANGVFQADTMHNLVHLISGILLLWASYKAAAKTGMVLKVLGIVYLLVTILGFMSSDGMVLGMMMNGADNWLHLILAVVFLWAGFMSGKGSQMSSNQPMM